jgi:hypothetical protein
MDHDSANRLICAVRWGHGMLRLLDQFKHAPETTIGQLHEAFQSQFRVNPRDDWFYFNNQDQFMTLLWAYLCVPSERFHETLPDTNVHDLNSRWGLSRAKVNGPKTLRGVVKSLRNAVSHAHVAVSASPLTFEFTNRAEKILIDEQGLQQLCRALNYWCLTSDPDLKAIDG